MSVDSFPSVSGLLDHWSGLPLPFPPLLSYLGGDIVRLALTQLTGYASGRPRRFDLGIAPVPLSYGWAAFGIQSIMAVFFKQRLIPWVIPSSGRNAFVKNCAGDTWSNQSWIVEQLLETFERKHKLAETDGLMCIGLFELEPFIQGEKPQHTRDRIWWAGWTTIAIQLGMAIVPWALYGDDVVAMFVVSGTAMTLLISALPQWRQEKWAGSMSKGKCAHTLARKHPWHVMVFRGQRNSYNLEALATSQPQYFTQRPSVMFVLAPLCACFLMCTAKLMAHSWFLVGIGGLGMLYNVYAAKMQRTAEESGLKIKQIQSKPVFMPVFVDTPEDGKRAVLNTQRQLRKELQDELQDLIPEAVHAIMSHWQALSSG